MSENLEGGIIQKIKEKLQEEIDDILSNLKEEMKSGTEDTIYRNAKLFVFAKSIKTNIQGFTLELEKSHLLNDFINSLENDENDHRGNFIETLYVWLYESNGTKYDLFMDRIRLLEYIEQFLKSK